MFLQKTAKDSVAIFTTSNSNFLLPITLSTGTGIDDFLTLNAAPQNTVIRQTVNGNVIKYIRPSVITGTITLHPQSNALPALREITEYQNTTRIPVKGTLLVINFGAVQFDKYTGFYFTSPYTGPSRGKVLSDVNFTFASNPATGLSLAAAQSIFTSLSGVGAI